MNNFRKKYNLININKPTYSRFKYETEIKIIRFENECVISILKNTS